VEYKELLKKSRKVKTINDLRDFIKDYFKNEKVEVFLFGSRARKTHTDCSDIDIAFESQKNISKELSLLRELLDESNLPYKVDVIDLKETPYLKETIKKEGIKWL